MAWCRLRPLRLALVQQPPSWLPQTTAWFSWTQRFNLTVLAGPPGAAASEVVPVVAALLVPATATDIA